MFKRILRSFSRTNINLHDKSIYQLPHIFLHGKTFTLLHGVHLHILHDTFLHVCKLANLLAFWFQSTEKEIFTCCHQGGCSTASVSNTLYYCTSYSLQVRQRLFGVTLTRYQPVDENNNATLLCCDDVTRENPFSLSNNSVLANYATCSHLEHLSCERRNVVARCVTVELDTIQTGLSSRLANSLFNSSHFEPSPPSADTQVKSTKGKLRWGASAV